MQSELSATSLLPLEHQRKTVSWQFWRDQTWQWWKEEFWKPRLGVWRLMWLQFMTRQRSSESYSLSHTFKTRRPMCFKGGKHWLSPAWSSYAFCTTSFDDFNLWFISVLKLDSVWAWWTENESRFPMTRPVEEKARYPRSFLRLIGIREIRDSADEGRDGEGVYQSRRSARCGGAEPGITF